MVTGMSRPLPSPPPQSSMTQSLYALMHQSPTSRSGCSENVCPQNRGSVFGKQAAAST